MRKLRWVLAAVCGVVALVLVGTTSDALGAEDTTIVGALLALVAVFALVMPNPARQRFWGWLGRSPEVVAGIGMAITFAAIMKAVSHRGYDPMTLVGAGMVTYGVMARWKKGEKTEGQEQK